MQSDPEEKLRNVYTKYNAWRKLAYDLVGGDKAYHALSKEARMAVRNHAKE